MTVVSGGNEFPGKVRLDGMTALVTGGGRGIGAATAGTLACAGAEVVVMSRTRADLDQVVAGIKASGGKASALACDVTDGACVREAIAALPRLDILINNAGINIPEAFVDVSLEHLDTMLNLNVRAMFVVAQAAARKMMELPRAPRGGGRHREHHLANGTRRIGAPDGLLHDQARHRRAYEGYGRGACAAEYPRQFGGADVPGDTVYRAVLQGPEV